MIDEVNVNRSPESKELVAWKEQVILVSGTRYPDYVSREKRRQAGYLKNISNVRADQALESLQACVENGFRLVYVDDGSSKDFRIAFHEIDYGPVRRAGESDHSVPPRFTDDDLRKRMGLGSGHLLSSTKLGYSPDRVKGMNWASLHLDKNRCIGQIEGEKFILTTEDNLQKLSYPILSGEAHIVIPDRGIRSIEVGDEYDDFRGYTEVQAVSERKANIEQHKDWVAKGFRDVDDPILDLIGGSRFILNDPEMLELFGLKLKIVDPDLQSKLKPNVYTNALYSPVPVVLATGKYKVASVLLDDFEYPKEMQAVEQGDPAFKEKRKSQFDDVVGTSRILIDYLGSIKEKLKDMATNGKRTWEQVEEIIRTDPEPGKVVWDRSPNQILNPRELTSSGTYKDIIGYIPFNDSPEAHKIAQEFNNRLIDVRAKERWFDQDKYIKELAEDIYLVYFNNLKISRLTYKSAWHETKQYLKDLNFRDHDQKMAMTLEDISRRLNRPKFSYEVLLAQIGNLIEGKIEIESADKRELAESIFNSVVDLEEGQEKENLTLWIKYKLGSKSI